MQIHCFSLVLSTLALFVLYRDDGILNGVWATGTFRKSSEKVQNKMLTACGPQHDFAKIINGVWATATFCLRAKIEVGPLIGRALRG